MDANLFKAERLVRLASNAARAGSFYGIFTSNRISSRYGKGDRSSLRAPN